MNKAVVYIVMFALALPLSAADTTICAYANQLSFVSRMASGDYLNWNEPERLFYNNITLTGSTKAIHNSVLSGSIGYSNQYDKGTIWPFYSDDLFPYLVVDLTKKNLVGNTIAIKGHYGYTASARIQTGIDIGYTTNTTYNTSDPRYKTDVSAFKFKPFLIFGTGALKINYSPSFSGGNSEMNMRVETPSHYVYVYQNLGLGFSQNPTLTANYSLRYTQKEMGSFLQVSYKAKKLGAGIYGGVTATSVSVDRGKYTWSVVIPEATISGMKTHVQPFLMYNGSTIHHKLVMDFLMESRTGKEFIRREVENRDNYNEVWINFGTVDKYQLRNIDKLIRYSFTHTNPKASLMLETGLEQRQHTQRYDGIVKPYTFRYTLNEPYLALAWSYTIPARVTSFNLKYQKQQLQVHEMDANEGILSQTIYEQQIKYLSGHASIFSLNCTFGKRFTFGERITMWNLNGNGTFIIPGQRNSMRSIVSLGLDVNF